MGKGFENGPLPLKANVAATEGLIQAREIFPSATARSSRNPSAAKESETPFSCCERVVVSDSLSE